MTREEAIEILNRDDNEMRKGWFCINDFIAIEVLKKADVVEREVLDKIRAEIMQLDYDIESVDYDYNDMVQTEEVHMICREEVLRIIDKYKAESEVEDGNDIHNR